MNQQNQLKIEELLESLGSEETPGDTSHRYALRRAILNSPHFEKNQSNFGWDFVYGLTGSVAVGGLVVVAFFAFVSFSNGSLESQTVTDDQKQIVTVNQPYPAYISDDTEVLAEADLYHKRPIPVQFINNKIVPVSNVMNFVNSQIDFALNQ
ncbi:hypothetical protein ACFLZY_02545 [Patescibacteria group bacterium]